MKKHKSRFQELLIKEDKEEKVEDLRETKDDLTESILGLFESMEEISEVENNQEDVKKQMLVQGSEIKLKKDKDVNLQRDVNNKEIIINNAVEYKKQNKYSEKVKNNEEIYKNMATLAQSLGYELLDSSKIQISKDYYEKINAYKSEDEKIIEQLLSLEKGFVLSKLYNAYKNVHDIGLDNLEAVMSNFFSTLFDMGFEVNEDDAEVGENIIVNTKDLFKEFLFSKSVNKDGKINGQVEYLSWNYKGKMIMPKIVKPIE